MSEPVDVERAKVDFLYFIEQLGFKPPENAALHEWVQAVLDRHSPGKFSLLHSRSGRMMLISTPYNPTYQDTLDRLMGSHEPGDNL